MKNTLKLIFQNLEMCASKYMGNVLLLTYALEIIKKTVLYMRIEWLAIVVFCR